MTTFATLVAIAATLSALAYLAATDPKRRRVFHLPPFEGRRRARLALAVVFLPGFLLLVFGDSAGFVVWLGAITVTGWGLAALTPAGGRRLVFWVERSAAKACAAFARAVMVMAAAAETVIGTVEALRRGPQRIAALEQRVLELELQLARIRAAQAHGVRPEPAAANSEAPTAPASEPLRSFR